MFRSPACPSPLSAVAAFRRAVLTVGCVAALFAPSLARAQAPGDLDPDFTSVLLGSTFYALSLHNVSGTPLLFAAGDFDLVGQLTDTGRNAEVFTFAEFGSLQRLVYTAVPEMVSSTSFLGPKLLLGGLFGRDSDQIRAKTAAQNIIRLQPTGEIDTDFNPGTGANNFVTAILPLSDGGMVVGGLFTLFNKQNHQSIVRLDNNGAIVDNTQFSTSLNFDAGILSLAAQQNPDTAGAQGQILAAGTFSNVNGKGRAHLARINADGTLDEGFHPIFDDRVRVVVSQADGKILAGGDFYNVNGVSAKHLVRLNYDGSVDTSFSAQVTDQPPFIAAPVAVNVIVPFNGNRYYIGGNFAKINGVTRNYLGAVLADGTVDSFDPGTAITNAVEQLQVDQVTNRVYVGELRSKEINMVYPPSLIRLYGDTASPRVNVSASQPVTVMVSGKTKLAGTFTFTRTEDDLADPLTVYFARGGTASLRTAGNTQGAYKFGLGTVFASSVDGTQTYSVTFPADTSSVTISVLETKIDATGKTVQLTLVSDPGTTEHYTPGGSPVATVTLIKP